MMPGFLRSARYIVGILLILAAAAGVIGYAWYAAIQSTAAQREDALVRANGIAGGLAAAYTDQITRQILALDQTMDLMVKEWEADSRRFNLEAMRARARVLTGISRDMFLADENGVIRQSSVPEFVGQSIADLSVFRNAAEHTNDKPKLYVGGAMVNAIMRQWHLDVARTLHYPDGSFAGIINTDYRVAAITGVFEASPPPGNGFAGLINLTDGKLRAAFGPVTVTPDTAIAETPMFEAVDAKETGFWSGPSAADAVVRLHAFRRIPGRDLAVIAGLDRQQVLGPSETWQTQSRQFCAAITALATLISAILLLVLRAARRREAVVRESHAILAAANALAEVSRAQTDAISRRLQATFSAVSDGVAIFDAHLNLVEWNGHFHERSGVNASLVRTGMTMEDVLRTQARAGYFGEDVDVEVEVERRAALLRAGNFGANVSFQASGRIIELRCRALPEGGFVALYTDVTEARQARQALRDARDRLEREQASRIRFLGAIGHEIRERAALLFQSIGWLRSVDLPPAPNDALDRAQRATAALETLAADTAEVPRMQAGAIELRPAMLEMRLLLRDIVDKIQPEARDRGLMVYLVVNKGAPPELIADPARLRQIVTLLLSEAVRFAAPDTMWLMADPGGPGEDGEVALRVTIRGFGAPIPEAPGGGIFRSFDAVAAPRDSGTMTEAPGSSRPASVDQGTGLALTIARHLTGLMGGQLKCETWSTLDGRTGNDFILTLPPRLLPGQTGRAPGQIPAAGRPAPRTRVLMAGERTGLRLAAATMLRRDGHMVETVETGEDAMQSLENTPYDIVFIDTALADMTIETAAATIRGLMGPARSVPVVALAPTQDETETRAWQAAGVDDILVSPATFAALTEAIDRNVWLAKSRTGGFGSMAAWQDEMEEGIPILSVERIEELRANIPADELREMAEECISDLSHRLPALRRALTAAAPAAITVQCHTMVGIAGGYGMAVLEARLRAIQAAVRERRLHTIDGAAEVIETDLTRAAAALRRAMRRGLGSRTATAAGPVPEHAEPAPPPAGD
ncbi:MAG: response regulator [Acetobacteraceae bacterium]|nr:response regulator [Acetobacteraceae bacterium]